jgi:hypothetical protein
MIPWIYNGLPVIEIDPQYFGFVYIITNNTDGRAYYGKKGCFFKKTSYKVTTRKNGVKYKKKIRSLVNSDWPTYYGSSAELQKDVELHGESNFTREILKFCKTSSELSYYELRYQVVSDCLLYPHLYYNSWISGKIRRSNLLPK